MPDALIILRLQTLLEHISIIEQYSERISEAEDFYTQEGNLVLDAVLMRLQVLGEHSKTINKKYPSLLASSVEDISLIIRFRDLLSHHYDNIKPELVFEICTQHIPRLKQQIEELLKSFK